MISGDPGAVALSIEAQLDVSYGSGREGQAPTTIGSSTLNSRRLY
jgi:hypothetical protein